MRASTADSPNRKTKKTTEITVTTTRFSQHMMEQRDNADLHMDLKRSQAEEEHLKNLLIGLNEKLAVFNDLQNDLHQNKSMLSQSEKARDDLQDHIQKLADQVSMDAQQHKRLQDDLCNQIAAHEATIQQMHATAAQVKA